MNVQFHLALITKWMLINDILSTEIRVNNDYLYIKFDDHQGIFNIHDISALNLVDELIKKYDEIILSLND